MILVVDTNIVFSALIHANSTMGEILLSTQSELQFFAPELLLEELSRYQAKLLKASKLSEIQLEEAKFRILERLNFISEDLINENAWQQAYLLTKDVDEDDTPFVALSIALNAQLWTGDQRLHRGLMEKGSEIALSTSQILAYLTK